MATTIKLLDFLLQDLNFGILAVAASSRKYTTDVHIFTEWSILLSPFRVGCHAVDQLLVVADFGLQPHLHAQQIVVGLHMALHLGPHLPQLRLQLQYQLVERRQALAVLLLGALQGVLQIVDLDGEAWGDYWTL